MNGLTHIDNEGRAVMVDITDKAESKRMAVASGRIKMSTEAFEAIKQGNIKKGDALGTARIAGIMAAKKTSSLIPLCHPLMLSKVDIDFSFDEDEPAVVCKCHVSLTGKTGAEMEALTGVSTALLTVYDMCKAVDKRMEIGCIRLEEKDGGKSGHFMR